MSLVCCLLLFDILFLTFGGGPLLVGAPVHVHMLHMPKFGPGTSVFIRTAISNLLIFFGYFKRRGEKLAANYDVSINY